MLVEELKELARSIQEQRAEEQKIKVKAAHIDCPKRLYDTLSSFFKSRYRWNFDLWFG